MRLLAAGIDSTVIALWLGHESIETTQIYLHADMKTKEDALARTTTHRNQTGTLQDHRRHPPRLPPSALNYADLTSATSHAEQDFTTTSA